MNRNVQWVLGWIDRMVDRYGGCIYDKNGLVHDWGQALARTCYGDNWTEVVPENPTDLDITKAIDWEKGNCPAWVDIRRLQPKASEESCQK